MSKATRQTAGERREAVLAAALVAFAQGGLYGTSTEDIARAAGISQPYLFRLFGTKKKLFVATVERCMADTLELFRAAAGDRRGEEALEAMGRASAVISHAGVGNILCALESGHVPVVMAREARYGETVDDHQVELSRALEPTGQIILAETAADLPAAVERAPCAPSARQRDRP